MESVRILTLTKSNYLCNLTLIAMLQYSNKQEPSRRSLILRRAKEKAVMKTQGKTLRPIKKLGAQRRVPITMLTCGTWRAQKMKMI